MKAVAMHGRKPLPDKALEHFAAGQNAVRVNIRRRLGIGTLHIPEHIRLMGVAQLLRQANAAFFVGPGLVKHHTGLGHKGAHMGGQLV